jgi:oligopeptide/dipeptide ABC transporter ATP-binding protein
LPTKPEQGAPGQVSVAVEPILTIRDLHVHYALRTNAVARLLGRSSGVVPAVDGVDIEIAPSEVLGVVGESGSGKSTLGRALLGLVHPSSGSIRYRGRELVGLSESELRPLRRSLQMVFQDPHASLNPSMTVGTAISDALRIHGLFPDDRARAVAEALERVGLAPAARFSSKYPGELSGGQTQRAAIARAIALSPGLLVADEPISMLDMSVRAKILGLLQQLKQDLGLTYLYITHDLASARFFCDRIAIMYLGKIIEIGSTDEIFLNPRHPYTKALLRAVPDPDPSKSIPRDQPRGEVPDASDPPAGCPFHPRCPEALPQCGWETRDIRMILEQRWTSVSAEQYAREARLVGDETAFASSERDPEVGILRPASGTAEGLLELLVDERHRNPGDPLWRGVSDLSVNGRDVCVRFVARQQPQLLPVLGSSVRVSCHLHRSAPRAQ